MTYKEMAAKLGLVIEEKRLGYHLSNNPNRLMKGRIEFITIHQTDNESLGAGAMNHHNYLANNSQGRKASWHYTVDEKGAIQSFRDNRVLWHSANSQANENSLSIEMCVDDDAPGGIVMMGEENYKKTLDNGAKLTAINLVQYSLNPQCVKQHHDWINDKTGLRKNCPSYIRSKTYGISWEDFLSLVYKYYEELTKPEPVKIITEKPAPEGKLYRLSIGAAKYKSNLYEDMEKAKAAGLEPYFTLIDDLKRSNN